MRFRITQQPGDARRLRLRLFGFRLVALQFLVELPRVRQTAAAFLLQRRLQGRGFLFQIRHLSLEPRGFSLALRQFGRARGEIL